MRGQHHAPAAIYPRERPGTHCTGGWVGLRAGLDRCGKSRPPPGFDPRTVQPVASLYTDYATRPIPKMKITWKKTPTALWTGHALDKAMELSSDRLREERCEVCAKYKFMGQIC